MFAFTRTVPEERNVYKGWFRSYGAWTDLFIVPINILLLRSLDSFWLRLAAKRAACAVD